MPRIVPPPLSSPRTPVRIFQYSTEDVTLSKNPKFRYGCPSTTGVVLTESRFCKVLLFLRAEIKELEYKESPDAKLECVVRCSRHLCQALRIDKQGRGLVSANELQPAMVLVLLRANPPFLHSNIKYVTWFGAPTNVQAGEDGYYFAHLCSAVSFIKTLTTIPRYAPVDETDGSR